MLHPVPMDTWWSADQVRTLRVGDVMPLPLMVETNWAKDGWEVNVTLVTEVVPDGYSSVNIWTYRESYGENGSDEQEAERVTKSAITAFGRRLRAVLGGDQESGG